ncbi:MAG: hypothetical protein ACI4E1_07655 [Lachnospira sp.]
METKYILKHKFILILILAAIVNILVFYKSLLDFESVFYDDNGYSYSEYVEIYSEYIDIANNSASAETEDIISKLRVYQADNMTDSTRELYIAAYKAAISNINYVNNYNNQISETINESGQKLQSGLYSEGFGYYNLLKGRYDLKKINNLNLEPVVSIAVEKLYDYKMTPVISAIVLMILTGFYKYDNAGLNSVVKSTKNGRFYLAVKRSGIIVLLSVIVNIILYIPIVFIAFNRYGGLEYIDSYIQASEYFTFVPYVLDFKSILLLMTGFNIMSGITWALMYWFFSQLFTERTTGTVIAAFFVFIEYILYSFSYNNSVSEFFKDINVVNYLNLIETFVKYNNWGISEYLITTFSLTLAGMVITVFMFLVLNIFLSAKLWSGITIKSALTERIKRFISKCFAYMPGVLKELKKIIVNQRVGLLLAASLIIVWNYNFGIAGFASDEEIELKDYYEYVKGDAYQKTDEYLSDLNTWIDNAKVLYESYVESGDKLEAYEIRNLITKKEEKRDKVIEISSKVRSLNESGIGSARVVDSDKLTKRYGARTVNYSNNIAFLVMLFLVLSFSKTFAIEREKKTECIIRTTSGGGKRFLKRKIILEILISEIVVVTLFFIQLYRINNAFPMSNYELNASIKSLELFQDSSVSITFFQLEAICLFMRMVIIGMISMIISMASLIYNESVIYAGSLLAAAPYILECLGLKLFKNISVIHYFAFYEAAWSNTAIKYLLFILILVAVLFIFSYRGIKRWEIF